MADIVLPDDFGESISVDGKCYYRSHLDTAAATHSPSDVDGSFANCDSCGVSLNNFTISGTVSGTVFSGVTVNLTGAATRSTVTGIDGSYIFTGLGNGGYIVAPNRPGTVFIPSTTSVIISGSNVVDVNFLSTEPSSSSSSPSSSSLSSSSLSSSSSSSNGTLPPLPPPGDPPSHAGDPHFYLLSDLAAGSPNLASFNVDDNGGTDPIYWFYSEFTDSSNNVSLVYSNQEFALTSGGKSINAITLTVGLSTYAYTLSDSQATWYKNGSVWNGPDSYSVGGVNLTISARRITGNTQCIGDRRYFSLFELTIEPNNDLYNAIAVGGAQWHIWKKLSTEAAGPINNPSYAGLDGVGAYTGISRASFVAGPQSETIGDVGADMTVDQYQIILVNLYNKMVELYGITGTVSFDWDPLIQLGPFCPLDTCAYPLLDCSTVDSASAWQPSTAYSIGDVVKSVINLDPWGSGTSYQEGDIIRTGSGDRMQCVVAGTSGGTVPSWNAVLGEPTDDNTVTWVSVPLSSGEWYECIVGGTSDSGEPSWDSAIGSSTSDGTVTWQRVSNAVTWVGKKWILPTDNAVVRELCPTSYSKSNAIRTNFYPITTFRSVSRTVTAWTAKHNWNGAINMGLSYIVTYDPVYFSGFRFMCCGLNGFAVINGKWLDPNVAGTIFGDRIQCYGSPSVQATRPIPVGAHFSSDYELGPKLNPSVLATFSNYDLTSDFFGSYVSGGVTYTWNKGTGW